MVVYRCQSKIFGRSSADLWFMNSLGGTNQILKNRLVANGGRSPMKYKPRCRRVPLRCHAKETSITKDVTSANRRPSFFVQDAHPAPNPARTRNRGWTGAVSQYKQ